MWNKGFFSKDGRLILIKFMLSGILVNCLLLFRAFSSMSRSIEKYRRFYVGGGGRESRFPSGELGDGGAPSVRGFRDW